MSDTVRALIVVDERIPEGQIYVGGVVVLGCCTDAERGWAVLAKPVRVSSEEKAKKLEEELLSGGDFQFRRLIDGKLKKP